MNMNRSLSVGNLENLNFEETKRNVNHYFMNLEKIEWELAKLNAQQGLTANYNFETEYMNQPYIPIGQDAFHLIAKDNKEEELKRYISSYYWASSVLSEQEQIYISECFMNHRYEDEIVERLGYTSSDSNEFRRLKRSALYKFADFLKLLKEKS